MCSSDLFDYLRQHDLPIKVARIFNTYGPHMHPADGRVVSNFIVQALRGDPITIYGDGSQTRSFCYVEDEVDGIVRLFESDRVEPVNVGNPNEFTIRELADVVLEETGSASEIVSLPLPADDPKVRQPDITVARDVLGWEPKIQLREGIRRTIPHLLGVSCGHAFMIFVLGAGLVKVFEAFPVVLVAMKWVSVAYLLYLSWKIATAAPKSPDAPETTGKPFTALQAAAFQWVNPKGWFMALTALSAYTVEHTLFSVALVSVVFCLVNLPSCASWVTLGQQMRVFLTSPARLRAFNWTMAILLVLTLIPILRGH